MKRIKKHMPLAIALVIIITIIVALQSQRPTRTGAEQDVITMTNAQKETVYPKAVELVSPDGYINVDNISLKDNIGKKVILVDFWTYSCINCQRTLPYLNEWHRKYADSGLLIIGVHTPEFEFEKDIENVRSAVEKYGVKYPVILDNGYRTWSAYQNRYWPRKYLVDIDGYIVYDHIGEGAYGETEAKIQELLNERAERLNINTPMPTGLSRPNSSGVDYTRIGTPEIYMGYDFSRDQMGNSEGWQPDKTVNYTLPAMRKRNYFYLEGHWKNNPDNMELQAEGRLLLTYSSKDINIVAGSDEPIIINVFIDGMNTRNVTIKGFDLYNLHSAPDYGQHEIKIVGEKGFKAYTFTFG